MRALGNSRQERHPAIDLLKLGLQCLYRLSQRRCCTWQFPLTCLECPLRLAQFSWPLLALPGLQQLIEFLISAHRGLTLLSGYGRNPQQKPERASP